MAIDETTDQVPVDDRADDDGGTTRRQALAGLALGGVAVVGGGVGGTVVRRSGGAVSFRREELAVEVALLGDTFRFSEPAQTASEAEFRFPFLVEGWIYAADTIPPEGFIPVADGAIGRWFCQGWQLIDERRPEPHAASSQLFVFGEIRPDRLFPPDQISTDGLEGTFGSETATRSVIGGAGRYLGATGAVRQTPIGINTTVFADGSDDPAPNNRLEFDLIVVDG